MSPVPVLLAPANESVPGTLGVLGRRPEIAEIESSKLRNALGKLALEISGVLQDVKQVGEFKLKEVQVGVEITAFQTPIFSFQRNMHQLRRNMNISCHVLCRQQARWPWKRQK